MLLLHGLFGFESAELKFLKSFLLQVYFLQHSIDAHWKI